MEEYFEAEGTKDTITECLGQEFLLDREAGARCMQFLKENHDILSEDELFQYSKPEEYEKAGVSEFISEQGKYYINVKKSTIFLILLALEYKIPAARTAVRIAGFFQLCQLEGGFLKFDKNKLEYLCVLLELSRCGDRGAKKDLLGKFKGECCNNHLSCRYRERDTCKCREEMVEEILEELVEKKIVEKKAKKYYYKR